jgi:polysaccharide export outer membrane protein
MARTCFGRLVLALWTLSAGAVGAQEPGGSATYRIGPKDLLEIRVFEEKSLNVDLRVEEDGSIELPLLGSFDVGGLTEDEAAQRLEEALERSYLQKASVTVSIREYRSRPISVIGAVNSPGNLELSGRWTLLEALTAAGGLSDNHGGRVYVLRRAANGLTDQLTVDLEDLLVRGDVRYNIPIFAADLINVPVAVDISIFCLGEVASPGAVVFSSSDRPTLLAVIAKAGGLTERASAKIRVRRRASDGTVEEIEVNYKRILSGKDPDLEMRDGDLVVIKESFF